MVLNLIIGCRRSSVVYRPVGEYQGLELDACRDGEPVKQWVKGSDMREFGLVEHQMGSSILDTL